MLFHLLQLGVFMHGLFRALQIVPALQYPKTSQGFHGSRLHVGSSWAHCVTNSIHVETTISRTRMSSLESMQALVSHLRL